MQARKISGYLIVAMLVSVAMGLSACGGGGGGGGAITSQGQFQDSAVEGLSYAAGGLTGETDAQGTFFFPLGASVQFSIGGIKLPVATAKTVMTPVDLVPGARDEIDLTVTNIARLLQTLDDDGDPSNGITITEAVRNGAAGRSIDFGVTDFENDGNVQIVVSELTALTPAGPRILVSSQDAQDHLRVTLLGILSGTYSGTYTGDDVGTFTALVDAAGVITGSGVSTLIGGDFTFNGTVTSSGEATFAPVAGTISSGATFEGNMTFTGEVSGTWINSVTGDSGTFSGRKR